MAVLAVAQDAQTLVEPPAPARLAKVRTVVMQAARLASTVRLAVAAQVPLEVTVPLGLALATELAVTAVPAFPAASLERP